MASNFTSGTSGDTLKELCECPVCFNPYKDPRLLECGHQFCKECLSEILDQSPCQEICCPVCRNVTKPPQGDVKELPRAILHQHIQEVVFRQRSGTTQGKCSKCKSKQPIRHCPECEADLAFLCGDCFAIHEKVDRFGRHKTVEFDQNLLCSEHPLKQVDNFCHTCDKVTCVDCLFDGHGNHDIEPLALVANKNRQKLQEFAKRLAKLPDSSYIDVINAARTKISSDKANQLEKIEHFRAELKTLDAHAIEIHNQISSQMNDALDSLNTYQELVTQAVATKDAMTNLVTSLLRDDSSDLDVIISSKDIQEVATIDNLEVKVPVASEAELNKARQTVGSMKDMIKTQHQMETLDVQQSKYKMELVSDILCIGSFQGVCFNKKDNSIVIRDSDSKKQVKIFNTSGKLMQEFGDERITQGSEFSQKSIAIDFVRDLYLIPNSNGKFLRMEKDGKVKDIKKLGNSLFDVCYLPDNDQYALTDYKFIGKGRVFLVSPDSLSITKIIVSEMVSEFNVCVTKVNGEEALAISDLAKNTLKIWNTLGVLIEEYWTNKDMELHIKKHSGVAVDKYNRIVVCDHDAHRVLRVWRNKQEQNWVCLLDEKELQNNTPIHVDIAYSNNVELIAVGLPNRVKVYKMV